MTWIRSAAARGVLRAAASRGLATDRVLAAARVAALPDDVWATVPLVVHFAVLETCVRLLDDPGFVIDIAQHIPIETYDVMGFAMRSAPDLGAAYQVAERYQSLYTSSSTTESQLDAQGLSIRFRPSGPLPLAARCATESALAQILHVSRSLSGVHLVPEVVTFRHAAPRSTDRHRAFFGVAPTWEAPFASMRVSPADAARPVAMADPGLHAFLLKAAEAALAEHRPPDGFVDQVRSTIAELLPSGKLTIESLAGRLGTTERTLRRRLTDHGATFLELRDEVRTQLARRYLAERGLPVAEIAFLLDYADERAFRRAFERATGATPAQFRASLPAG